MSNLFTGSQGLVIHNSNFHASTTYNTTGLKGFDLLVKAVSPNAFHNSDDRPDPPRCHENTRVAVINRIIDWVTGKIDTDSFILWLYGPAGAGKSAIARTIAERCEELGLLLGSFFFFRTDPARNTTRQFVASLAYCIALTVPPARVLIEQVVESNPLIFQYSLDTQLAKLVLEPLQHLFNQETPRLAPQPLLILIDGLDECLDEDSQAQLIKAISSASRRVPAPLRFLISSRPERHISFALNACGPSIVSHLELNNDLSPGKDILLFLTNKFRSMKENHPYRTLIPSCWPHEDQLHLLTRKASGQFIYASLAAHFIGSPRHLPTQRLDIVLDLRPADSDLPFAELDQLYRFIFSRVSNIGLVLQILGIIIALRYEPHFQRLDIVEEILELKEPATSMVELADLHPVMKCKDMTSRNVFHHSSFIDFLINHQRAKDYYVDSRKSHTQILQWLLRMFRNDSSPTLRLDIFVTPSHFPSLRQHLVNCWVTPDLEDELKAFTLDTYMRTRLSMGEDLSSVLSHVKVSFLNALKEVNQHELHRHHTSLFERLIKPISAVDGCPSPDKFLVISAIRGAATKKLCFSRHFFKLYSYHRPSGFRVWDKMCREIFGFQTVDILWDLEHYRLLEPPDYYVYMRDMFEDNEPLWPIYGTPKGRKTIKPTDHRVCEGLVQVVIRLRNLLYCHGSHNTRKALHLLHSWAAKSTRSPWLSRRRTRFLNFRRGIRFNDPPRGEKLRSHSSSLRNLSHAFNAVPRFSEVGYFTARLKYLTALDLMRLVLHVVQESNEISALLLEPFILYPATVLFPKHTRRVMCAVQRYLEKLSCYNPDLQYSARMYDISASSSDEEGYATCNSDNEGPNGRD
ncbi:unnamed protein product [Cyclocybe aegerita]|uniref:NACHT domain-containing protein n=1 Tax=Cyclocybe aegerita TaxID=1973307 RepID=A0A8S0X8N6_CYCAE|nr:unnamed protein product [Cyclocybe aegerita]